MVIRWSALLLGTCLAVPACSAFAAPAEIVRDLAARAGPVVGQASACQNIAQGRVQTIVDQFREVIRQASPSDAELDQLTRGFNSYIADGRSRIATSQLNCQTAERQMAELERSLSQPTNSAPVLAPYSAAAATSATGAIQSSNAHGVTATEIKFGTVIPFSGVRKESGRQMKLGIDAAFNRANDAGGINGRMLRLIAADDGYDPDRTMAAITQLYDKDQVFGFIGNIGTANAAAAIPYVLDHRALFFAPHISGRAS
jgi:branched-chain amino acid transport system substrate-binding protein